MYFATSSYDELALRLRPQHAEAAPALEGASLIAPLPRRVTEGWVAVSTDTGDELDRLIDLTHAWVAGPKYP